jgi:hypothetical protein
MQVFFAIMQKIIECTEERQFCTIFVQNVFCGLHILLRVISLPCRLKMVQKGPCGRGSVKNPPQACAADYAKNSV